MDWVVSQQLHSRRLLEKKLNEIEAKKRQSEARRLRQIRDLGVDLDRLQKSTRNLDDVIGELSPRQQPRRGSLPCLDSSGGLSAYFQPSASPRSRRRLSCIAAIPAHQHNQLEELGSNKVTRTAAMTPDKQTGASKTEQRGTNPSTGQRRGSKSGEVINSNNSTSGKITSSDSSKPARLTGRRGSGGSNESSRKRDSEVTSHNVTAIYIHQDCQSTAASAQEGDDLSEAESHSMFTRATNRRRASEPALGGYYIQGLQNKAVDEIPAFLHHNSIENEELKESIKKNLPSDLVAEQDEEETEKKSEQTEDVNKARSSSSRSRQTEKLSSISETDQDGEEVSSNNRSTTDSAIRKNSNKSEGTSGKEASSDQPSFAALRQRRRSDGDVLKFNKIWKLRAQGRAQSGKGKVSGGATGANYDEDDDDENDEIWRAVRKCRYIRGYEPPEMKEPTDLSEFVFGHKNPTSLPPEQ